MLDHTRAASPRRQSKVYRFLDGTKTFSRRMALFYGGAYLMALALLEARR